MLWILWRSLRKQRTQTAKNTVEATMIWLPVCIVRFFCHHTSASHILLIKVYYLHYSMYIYNILWKITAENNYYLAVFERHMVLGNTQNTNSAAHRESAGTMNFWMEMKTQASTPFIICRWRCNFSWILKSFFPTFLSLRLAIRQHETDCYCSARFVFQLHMSAQSTE